MRVNQLIHVIFLLECLTHSKCSVNVTIITNHCFHQVCTICTVERGRRLRELKFRFRVTQFVSGREIQDSNSALEVESMLFNTALDSLYQSLFTIWLFKSTSPLLLKMITSFSYA